MGVIDTLSAGFDLVRKKPWLILPPVILDIGLWLAPRLSVRSMLSDLLRQVEAQVAASPEALSGLRESSQMLVAATEHANVLALISSSLPGVPSMPIPGKTSFFGWLQPSIELRFGLGFLGLILALLVAGLLIGTFYLGLIAQQVRDGHNSLQALRRRLPVYCLRLIGVFALLTALFMVVGFPLSLTASLLSLVSGSLGWMLMALFFYIGFWIMMYLAFVPAAILLTEDGALRAVWHSFNVVRRNFWSTLGLLVLIYIIQFGIMLVLERLTSSSAGALVAVVANAFIGTGLTTAVFVFYQDRYRAWRALAEENRSLARL